MSWLAAVRASALLLVERPGLAVTGLAGFLARGGVLLFILPFVTLPTPVGIGNWIGPTSITASGPAERLVWLIGAIVGMLVIGLAIGTVLGSFADLALFRAAGGRTRTSGRSRRGVDATLVLLRLVLIRLLALTPLALAVAWSAQRFGAAIYRELILPDELVTPLVLRVLDRTRDAVAIVILAWLAGEFVGGIAVRHHLRRGDPIPVALLRPAVDLVRRPVTTLATFAASAILPVVAVAPPLALAWFLFGGVRFALADGDLVLTIAAVVLFVAAWVSALALAGLVAAWRSLLGSFEVLRAGRDVPAPALPMTVPAEA